MARPRQSGRTLAMAQRVMEREFAARGPFHHARLLMTSPRDPASPFASSVARPWNQRLRGLARASMKVRTQFGEIANGNPDASGAGRRHHHVTLLSLLGVVALGSGLATALHTTTHTEGVRKTESEHASNTRRKIERVASVRRRRSVGRDRVLTSIAAVRGDRSRMEDTSYVSACKRFHAVFDGHGGAAVSEYLKNQLFPLVAPGLTRLDAGSSGSYDKEAVNNELEELLRQALKRVDSEVISRMEWKFQGSTAVGVVLFEDMIFSFNVGDSRAVMSRGGSVMELTRDHKPNDPLEKARIEQLGGTVKWYGYVDAQGIPIEPYGAYRVNGNLAVARAIGDRDLRPFVNGEPEILKFERDYDKDEFIVIASDGLWDVFSSEEAITFVHDVLNGELGGRESWRSAASNDTRVPIFEWSHQYKSDRGMIKAARARRKTQIANYLVQEALVRGTTDNVSVIVVWLK